MTDASVRAEAEDTAVPVAPDVDVVVAVHDLRRRVDRCVASALATRSARVRVTVVAHGLPMNEVRKALGAAGDGDVRVVEHHDGVRSPAGPFNRGLELATGEYVSIVGSDDFFDGDALDRWSAHCAEHGTDYLIAPLRDQSGAVWRDPLTRPRRRLRLDPVRDRLNYRAAPLGLVRRSYLAGTGVRLTAGLATGEDVELGLALLNGPGRIDFDPALPAYVIGQDAPARVTFEVRSAAAEFEALDLLSAKDWLRALDGRRRRAIAIKLWRMNVIPAVLLRGEADQWGPADIAALDRVATWLNALAPEATRSLSRAERAIADVAPGGDPAALVAAIARVRAASPLDRALTARPLHTLDRDALARRSLRLRLR